MRRRILVVASALGLILGACGGGGGDEATDTSAPDTTAAQTNTTVAADTPTTMAEEEPATTASAASGTVLTISAVDSEGFSTARLMAPVGEITIVFDNKDAGEEPHNIRVVTDAEEYFTAVTQGPDTQEMTFVINTPGDYQFICDTHLEAMTGVLTVTP